jgi:hypothetical protein
MSVLLAVYYTGVLLLTLVHAASGGFTARATIRFKGRSHRFPAVLMIIPLIVFWPITFPIQLYQSKNSRP